MAGTKKCATCKWTGTFGVGGKGAWTSSTCSKWLQWVGKGRGVSA